VETALRDAPSAPDADTLKRRLEEYRRAAAAASMPAGRE
jgi:hypothetical protein